MTPTTLESTRAPAPRISGERSGLQTMPRQSGPARPAWPFLVAAKRGLDNKGRLSADLPSGFAS